MSSNHPEKLSYCRQDDREIESESDEQQSSWEALLLDREIEQKDRERERESESDRRSPESWDETQKISMLGILRAELAAFAQEKNCSCQKYIRNCVYFLRVYTVA